MASVFALLEAFKRKEAAALGFFPCATASSDFYGGQTVYKDIVDFASKVPAYDCGAYYSDIRSALTDAITNVVQNNADIDSELETAQSTVEFSIEG